MIKWGVSIKIDDKINKIEQEINAIEQAARIKLQESKVREQKFLLFICLSFTFILFTAFTFTIIGIIDLRIINSIEISIYAERLLNTLMFTINMFFMVSIVLGIFDKKSVFITMGYLPIYIITTLLPLKYAGIYGFIFTTIIPILYLLFISISLKYKIKSVIFRILLFSVGISLYQYISMFIKLSYFNINANIMNSMTCLLLQIDLYILFILLYKVVKNYELVAKPFLLSEKNSVSTTENHSEKDLDISDLNAKQKFIFYALSIGYQLFQLIIVLLIGFINNRYIELPIMIIVFWISRKLLMYCWHSAKLWICNVATFAGFYLLSSLSPPLSISLFGCISLSAIFTYVLAKIGMIQEEYDALKEEKEKIKEFKLEPLCDKETLIEICKAKDMSAMETDLLVEHYANNKNYVQMQVKYHYSDRHIRRLVDSATNKFYK